ncbi:hypothetical protein B0T25DRAFT_566310 [Lasiosphaeria hispida]|uniref:Tat pathway signal sequence n=1 Tax=Lasiosphaeria hispida TaxID=260671 RepID=A0AAJ0HLW4_9PEZI|nr:hypothetical protein B0T25DRAFT_566310 [Lasiosphaeria hispida]
MPKSKTYRPVPVDEEGSLESYQDKAPSGWLHPELDREAPQTTSPRLKSHWAWLAHAVLLSASVTFFALSLCMKNTASSSLSDFLPQIATYSPLFPAVEYAPQKFKLAPIVKDSPYAGYGPSVDKAWDYIANDIGDIMITEQERQKLGLSPDSLKIQDPRTGEWGYRAGVEVFHQLHCLNLLRQAVYRDYYGRKEVGGDVGDADGVEDLMGHVDHCIEAIRQNLMCQSDVSVFTFKTFPELADEGIEGEWPDFEINHMCRNFEAVRKWNNDHVAAWDHDV